MELNNMLDELKEVHTSKKKNQKKTKEGLKSFEV